MAIQQNLCTISRISPGISVGFLSEWQKLSLTRWVGCQSLSLIRRLMMNRKMKLWAKNSSKHFSKYKVKKVKKYTYYFCFCIKRFELIKPDFLSIFLVDDNCLLTHFLTKDKSLSKNVHGLWGWFRKPYLIIARLTSEVGIMVRHYCLFVVTPSYSLFMLYFWLFLLF